MSSISPSCASTNVEDESLLVDYDPVEPTSATAAIARVSVKADNKRGSSDMLSDVSFRDLCLRPEVLRAVTQAGFEHPSQVQASTLPQAVLGTDIICQSASGSGKTAVFVIATLQQLPSIITPGMIDTIVLAHTREMAHQICMEFTRLGRYIDGFKCGEYYGGVPESTNRASLKNVIDRPTVAVGTPGRMASLIRQRLLPVHQTRRLVMDECDLLLATSVPMRADCQQIFKAMPREKQVMMFSATMSSSTKTLIRKFVTSALEVVISDERTLTLNRLLQYYVRVTSDGKNRLLCNLLDALEFNQVVIFVSSSARAIALASLLREQAFPAEAVHGNMAQADRLIIYDRVKDGKARLLVSTDLFARGVDFANINIAINYDMPLVHTSHGTTTTNSSNTSSSKSNKSDSKDKKHEDGDGKETTTAANSNGSASKATSSSTSGDVNTSDTYLHRVGRSGRFGTRGLAISFISSADDATLLEMVQSRFEVEVAALPDKIDVSSYM